MNWIKKIILKLVLKSVKNSLAAYEAKSPELKEFHDNLYKLSIQDFMGYAILTLGNKNSVDVQNTTFVQHLKNLIKPLDDSIENIIVLVLDGMQND